MDIATYQSRSDDVSIVPCGTQQLNPAHCRGYYFSRALSILNTFPSLFEGDNLRKGTENKQTHLPIDDVYTQFFLPGRVSSWQFNQSVVLLDQAS